MVLSQRATDDTLGVAQTKKRMNPEATPTTPSPFLKKLRPKTFIIKFMRNTILKYKFRPSLRKDARMQGGTQQIL